MSLKFYITLFSTALCLLSCSRKINPAAGYSQIKTQKSQPINTITGGNTQTVETNKAINVSLSLTDSVLVYNDTVFSNYKSFSFKTKPGKSYTIKISSLCDCFGFKKYLFNPEIQILNDQNKKTELQPDSSFFDYKYGPLALNKEWKISSSEPTVSFLVFANNQNLSKDIHSLTATVYYPVVIPLSVKIQESLAGYFVLRIEEQ